MRRAAKVDENHASIVAALRKVGCSVLSLAPIGGGVPDLLVARNGTTLLVEVKRRRGVLNERQVVFRDAWRGEVIVGVDPVDTAYAVMALTPPREWEEPPF